ncbi:hypothetical protein KAU11_02790, partial [Candidatus Babeliales bacterium]|nr:hypothetical protein [Candidatus Babeliales bacterium]
LNVETYYRFHALIADYGFVKLYGFAMRLIPDREATKQFVSTYGRLYQIVSMVSGSRYERQYQESIKAAQRIMKLMEARTHSEEGPGNARSMAQRVM